MLGSVVFAAHSADVTPAPRLRMDTTTALPSVVERPLQSDVVPVWTTASDNTSSQPGTPPLGTAVNSNDLLATGISEDFEAGLSAIAEQLRMDERTVVRLRSYLPDSGSLEFGMGMAHKALQRVRDGLIALGVKPVRILKEELREYAQRQGNAKRPGVEVQIEKKDRQSR